MLEILQYFLEAVLSDLFEISGRKRHCLTDRCESGVWKYHSDSLSLYKSVWMESLFSQSEDVEVLSVCQSFMI